MKMAVTAPAGQTAFATPRACAISTPPLDFARFVN
jgi:hypothetical protein